METAAGKIIKGLTAILVGHLLFNQSVSSISCSPEAPSPKFLCLLQHMVAEACHEKLIILQGRVILFIWVGAGSCPFLGVAYCTSISGRESTPMASQSCSEETSATISRWWHPAGLALGLPRIISRTREDLHKQEHHSLGRCGFRFHFNGYQRCNLGQVVFIYCCYYYCYHTSLYDSYCCYCSSLISCVIWGKLCNIFQPQFPPL